MNVIKFCFGKNKEFSQLTAYVHICIKVCQKDGNKCFPVAAKNEDNKANTNKQRKKLILIYTNPS